MQGKVGRVWSRHANPVNEWGKDVIIRIRASATRLASDNGFRGRLIDAGAWHLDIDQDLKGISIGTKIVPSRQSCRRKRFYCSHIYVMAPNSVIPHADKTTTQAQASSSVRRVAQLTDHLAPAQETELVNVRPTLPIQYPISRLQIDANQFIDQVQPLKVAVIGAGLAGINAGILLPAKVPGIQLTIFEKNSDVVSDPDNMLLLYLIFCRAVHGSKMCTLESDAIYRLMCTSPHSLQTHSGQRFLPKVRRSVTTGRHKPGGTAFMTT